MKILIIGNRLLGDAIDTLHAVHSLITHYQQQPPTSNTRHGEKDEKTTVRYSFLGYRYSAMVYQKLTLDLGITFEEEIFLEDYLRVSKNPSSSSAYYPGVRFSWSVITNLVPTLRQAKYDLAFIMPGGIIFGIISFLARIPERLGHSTDARRWLLTKTARLSTEQPNYQNATDILNLYHEKVSFVPYRPKIPAPVKPIELGLQANLSWEKCFIIASQASEIQRAWPGTRFREVARIMEEEQGLTALWIGMEAEKSIIDELYAGVGVNLAGRLSWDTLLSLLGGTRFLLTNDTGIAHIAPLITPTFILFGPSSPVQARPYAFNDYCTPILIEDCQIPYKDRKAERYQSALDMKHIPVKQVVSTIEKRLSL